MKSMHDVWSKRFLHYMEELQKYLRFVFTGHIAIVIVFVVGALGYRYSEWLKVAPSDFPAEWLVAITVGIVLAFSTPTTLLKQPDSVYLLPLESSMKAYFKKALNWTFMSQILVPVGLYIIAIPLLNTVTKLEPSQIWFGLLVVAVLKYFNVQIEFNYRYANRGKMLWVDRLARMLLSMLTLQTVLMEGMAMSAVYVLLFVAYNLMLVKRVALMPIPYEHFIGVEQSRMMRFYRFANYFTDVPHLRGAVRRRAWGDFVYRFVKYSKGNTQLYLVWRTFMRTNDHFYLWLRLTAISVVVAMFAGVPVVVWIVAAAMSFAMVLQLKHALMSNVEFRMDMLYPVPVGQRALAVNALLRTVNIVHALLVGLFTIGQPLFYVTVVVIIVVGEVTIRMTKVK